MSEFDDAAAKGSDALDDAERLIWALLDGNLDEADCSRLSTLIEQDASVRARYIDCVQLHVDLQEHFSAQPEGSASGPPPVLPNLFPGLFPGDVVPRVTEQ